MTNSEVEGLTRQQVEESRARYGINELTPPKRPPLWRLYLEKFQDPVIRILLVAALLSLIVAFIEHDFAETIGIVCAVLLATAIGFYFEYDASRKFDMLNALGNEAPVRVVRDGAVTEVPRRDVVVGDLLLLEAGDEVPADALLVQAVNLQVNESSLTGEPMVGKSTNPDDFDERAPYPTNALMRSSTLLEGSARARVTAVGDATEIGKVAREAMVMTTEKTPLNKQLNRLASLINIVGYTVAVVAFLVFSVREGFMFCEDVAVWDAQAYLHLFKMVLDNFMMAVALIVMAVPEGLPMAVTLSLALNMRRMLKTNNLVRKMHACETMGAITMICTDKTGTLTQNRMSVSELVQSGAQAAVLAEALACNTTAHLNKEHDAGLGNPTEVALLLWLQQQGVDYETLRKNNPRLQRVPFSSERKYMATEVHSQTFQSNVLYVKGAPEMILKHCAMDDRQREEYEKQLAEWQGRAQRTLAVAYKEMAEEKECGAAVEDGNLVLLAIVAISDPVRQEVPKAVADCLAAGVKVKMVTGDSTATAVEIARQIGLWTDEDQEGIQSMEGADFAGLTDEEALERISGLKIMSRARPLDKQRLVKLLQLRNEVVAVTGDGVNDAPALNFAQVGISMGSGTSVAREASDITLLDDSFRTIVTAIMWGRSLYKNIQRFIYFQLTINFTALLVVLVGAFVGKELPLTVTQILWVNLIMDTFAALALASLPADPSVMKERPRPVSQFIITPPMRYGILGYGTFFVAVLLGLMFYFGLDKRISVHELTFFFTFFVMMQYWNLFNAKAFSTSFSAFRGMRECYGFWIVLFFIALGQWMIVTWGGNVFRSEPLSWMEWAVIIGASSAVLWIGELQRWVSRVVKRKQKG